MYRSAVLVALALCLPLPSLFAKSVAAFKRQGQGIHEIVALVIIGDRSVVQDLMIWEDLQADVLSAPVSKPDIETIGKTIHGWVTAQGYIFATVQHREKGLEDGHLAYTVRVGNPGEISVVGNKYYSADQVIKNVGLTSNSKFDFRSLHEDLFALNTEPSATVDTSIAPKDEVKLAVTDELLVHGSLTLSNTGSPFVGDWRLCSTLEHLNLTKHDDILTAEWLTNPENLDEVNAFTGRYYRPLGPKNNVTFHAGWSETGFNVLEFDIRGHGRFLGAHFNRVVYSSPRHTLDVSAGWTYKQSETQIGFANFNLDASVLRLSMPNVTIGFSDKVFDSLGGRTFASLGMLRNFAGHFGASGMDSIRRRSANADGNLTITKFRLARFQRLCKGVTLVGKIDSQYTNDWLDPVLQKRLGGADSVRGYSESEFSGDSGFNGTLELRSPLFSNFIPQLSRTEEKIGSDPDHWSVHRLQAIGFYDFGHIHRNYRFAGLGEDDSASSLGLGVRFRISPYSQLKCDYGVPLISTESSRDGRGHLSLSLQF